VAVSPKRHAELDQFHSSCVEVLDKYVESLRADHQRYRNANDGRDMDPAYAHNDFTRILMQQIPPGMLAGLLAEAILRLSRNWKVRK